MDAAGNRVKREYLDIVVIPNKSATDSTINEPEDKNDLLNNHSVTFYPNPTDGILLVEISGIENVRKSQLTLYDLSGREILQKSMIGETTSIDLTNQAIGTYILKVIIDGKSSDWKVIKQ